MPRPRLTPKHLTDQTPTDPIMSLGGHQFYVNPRSIQVSSTNILFKNVTQGGIFIQTYTPDLTTYKLVGTYSNAGLDEARAAEAYAPAYQKGAVAYPFTFPPLGLKNRQVYVAAYTMSFEQDDTWYIQYQLELWEVPLAKVSPTHEAVAPAQARAVPARGF